MKIRVAVIGAAGYTGIEALDQLLRHPSFEVVAAQSESQAGKKLYAVHPRFRGLTELTFVKTLELEADAWLLCVGHGRAAEFLRKHPPGHHVKVVDLSNEFRLDGDHGFVYGLPEAFEAEIRTANRVANPGCFATAIQLALLPLAKAGLLTQPVHITAITGSTGAGQAASPTTHFSWRAENISAYKIYEHQHLDEIGRTLRRQLPPADNGGGQTLPPLAFVPIRGDFKRGIYAVSQMSCELEQKAIDELFADTYAHARWTFVSAENPDLQQVQGSNLALLYPVVKDGQLAVISLIDNLGKGASGQAIQNLELMFGLID